MSATLAAPPALRDWQEFVGGVVRERYRSARANLVTRNVLTMFGAWGQPFGRGWVSGIGVGHQCFPDDPRKVRRADVAFHKLDRLSAQQAQTEGHMTVVPDLVVEVVSPNDLADEVNRKRVEWLAAGAGLVWVVYPLDQEVHAFPAGGGTVRVFGPADTLTADPVLPGFAAPVAELFRLPA